MKHAFDLPEIIPKFKVERANGDYERFKTTDRYR